MSEILFFPLCNKSGYLIVVRSFRQECILNAESRQSKPDLFIPEEDDFVVDYFDINCRLEAEQCAGGRSPKLVRTLNAALPEGEGAIHVVETAQSGVGNCAQK